MIYFILEFLRIFTPVIVREITKSLSYGDKCHLSITPRNFEFRRTFEFVIVEKYSHLVSDWKIFRDDTISEIEKELECNFCLRQVYLNLINYVGCKTFLLIMFSLIYCFVGDSAIKINRALCVEGSFCRSNENIRKH